MLTVEREEIDRRLGAGMVHQGLALSVAPLVRLELKRALAPEPGRNLVLVLDQVNDPHNVGAILRRAAAFDVRGLILPERRAPSSPASRPRPHPAPSIWCRWSRSPTSPGRSISWPSCGYWRLALDAGAEATIDQAPDADNLALVLGAEGSGLRRLVREHCDFAARLPIAAAMQSLNVSVACGIALYALARRGECSAAGDVQESCRTPAKKGCIRAVFPTNVRIEVYRSCITGHDDSSGETRRQTKPSDFGSSAHPIGTMAHRMLAVVQKHAGMRQK